MKQPPRLLRLTARLEPSRIYLLKFILEGYDGLAVLSTLDTPEGMIEVRCHASQTELVVQLLEEFGAEMERTRQ